MDEISKNSVAKNPSAADSVVIPRTLFNYILIAIVFLIVGIAIGVFAINLPQAQVASVVDEEAIARIVQDAIAAANIDAEDDNSARFELVDDDPYIGAEDAPIVIVEFSDFRCTFCGRHFAQTLDPLLENYGEHIRYVFRDFAGLGPESVNAALAANCAYEQESFWSFHAAFFSNQGILGKPFYMQVAEEEGIDVAAFEACFDERRYQSEIQTDIFDGQINGITGTPGFFVNGRFVSGAQPYQFFESLVLYELRRAGIDPSASSTQQADT